MVSLSPFCHHSQNGGNAFNGGESRRGAQSQDAVGVVRREVDAPVRPCGSTHPLALFLPDICFQQGHEPLVLVSRGTEGGRIDAEDSVCIARDGIDAAVVGSDGFGPLAARELLDPFIGME